VTTTSSDLQASIDELTKIRDDMLVALEAIGIINILAAAQSAGKLKRECAASILPSRPPNLAAAARRDRQGWPCLPRPPEGLGLDWPEHGGTLDRLDWRLPESAPERRAV
jgi:hypothetical protein